MENSGMVDALERFWDASRTPSWLSDSLDVIADRYKTARADVAQIDIEQVSEYHQQMFIHYYDMATHMRSCYSMGNVDLHSVRKFLNLCLEKYAQIPGDDRDFSMDSFSGFARDMLAEVEEECKQLSPTTNNSNSKDFVESSLAQGKIDNNSELLHHLKQCSEEDRKQLGQMLWSTQLVRLVIFLEEAALSQSFQRVEIPEESEACLSRAYHLAKFGKPSDSHRKSGKSLKKSDQGSVLYGGVKEHVRSLIYSEVVQHQQGLEQVKSAIERDVGKQLSITDTAFVEDEYKVLCLQQCLEEMTKSMSSFLRSDQQKDVVNTFSLLENVVTWDDIPDYFKSLHYHKELKLMFSLSEAEETTLVEHFKSVCMEQVVNYCETVQGELGLLKSLVTYLSNTRTVGAAVSRMGIDKQSLKIDFKKIADLTDTEHQEELNELKFQLSNLPQEKQLIIEDKIQNTLRGFMDPVRVERVSIDGRTVVEVLGKHVVLSEILVSVESELSVDLSTTEVHFIGGEVFHVDADLANDIWHGKNVAVRSKLIKVYGTVVWDVSGKSSKRKHGPARSASVEGGHGSPGDDGSPGGSGGNVLILTEQMTNCEGLTIASNGGDGSDGQDGGNGQKGRDGVGITREMLEEKFKSPVRFLASTSTRSQEVNRMIRAIERNFPHSTTRERTGNDIFLEALALDGGGAIFSYCEPKIFRNNSHSYFIHKGSLGKPGGEGGEFGLGGQGGYPGQVIVKSIKTRETFNVKKSTVTGQDGRSGASGLYGNTGNNGWDMGYLDYQLWFSTFYHGEDCRSKLTITYHDDSRKESVWCWYKNKYASITLVNPRDNFNASHRTRNYQQRDRKHSAKAVMKKTIIESSFIAKSDQYFGSVDENALLNMYTRIENIRQKALAASGDKSEQQRKASKRHKVHHIISHPNMEQDIDEPLTKIPNTVKRKTSNMTPLQSLAIRKNSLIDWMQLRLVRIEKMDLSRLFLLLEQTNLPTQKKKEIEQVLTDKHRLLAFEDITEKIRVETIYAEQCELVSRYASTCLEEDIEQKGIACHPDLGTLDEYLFQFDCKGQQRKLSAFCNRQNENIPSSVVQAFLVEAGTTENIDPSIQTHLDHFKTYSELQVFDSAGFLNTFMQELVHCKYALILKLWHHNEEDLSLAPTLSHEIDRDFRLRILHTRYINCVNKNSNWNQCLQNSSFLEAFCNSVVQKGPLSKSYRELLAYAFKVNIKLYTRDIYEKLSLHDDHNPGAHEKVYLLLQNNSFVKLSFNECLMRLENHRRAQSRNYRKISDRLLSLDSKNSIDDYLANQLYLYCDFIECNDAPSICNREPVNEIKSKFFTFGEGHFVEKLFSRSDVTASGNCSFLQNILLRFSAEGKLISTDEVHFLVNRHLAASYHGRSDEAFINWIILAYPQQQWVSEILLMHLERYYKEQLGEIKEWRVLLSKVDNKALLILLSAKLDPFGAGSFVTVDKMDRMLQMLCLTSIKTDTLVKLDLSEWYYVLEELYWIEKLSGVTRWQNIQILQEASYYTVSLLNNYSFEILEKFFQKLECQRAADRDILDVLCCVYNGRWSFSEGSIAELDNVSLQDWKKNMKSQIDNYQERGIAILVQLILDNNNASENILEKLPKIKKQVQKINAEKGKMKNILKTLTNPTDLLNKFRGKIARGQNLKNIDFSRKSLEEKLLEIDDAIHENLNFRLRNTQKLAVLTLLENNKNTLAQVATGEGKSLIVVAVAIIKASLGEKVDIITSSSVLAKRDAEQSKAIYAKFGINVSHNCSEDIEKRKGAYSENQVVYGDLSSFQRDYLLHKFYRKNVLGDRNFVNVIVDEVDSMLLDRGNNMLYLSHDLPDMDKLESVYVFIWQWVNNCTREVDATAIRNAVLWHMYGVVRPADIGKLDSALSEEQRHFIWNNLVDAKIIDGEGRVMVETVSKDDLEDVLRSEHSDYLDRLEFLLGECIDREKCIHVPNYLRSFVVSHLDSWIEAAKMALVMEAGQDYVVDVDRSGSSADRTPNITILDRDTGTDLVNSQWEAALHQFVQLKHGCKTYLQSLKAVFISNVSYFKLYKTLYGLSGTLGSHRERDLLEEIYGVDFVNIPTAKSKQFYENVPIVCRNASDWTDTIIESSRKMTERSNRSVLIICETLNDVTELYKSFGGKRATNVRTYTREYEEFDIKELPQKQIIIATNLAGRGTDIKITKELKYAGGVHVCLTYLPSNVRVEQQAFGRAARCGDKGSGQLIVLDTKESLNIMQLKRERDQRELRRISLIKKYYESRVVMEENCFRKFTEQYEELRKQLSTSGVTKGENELSDILMESCLDRWVYWLDDNGKHLDANAKQHSRRLLESSLEAFLTQLKSLKADNCESLMDWVGTSVPRMVTLGRYFVLNKQRKLAHELFDKIIAAEPHFSEAAHYYKAFTLSTEIDWNGDGLPAKVNEFSQELRSAASLFEERCLNLMTNVSLIDKTKTNFKDNVLPITAYKDQKAVICKFYGALTQSIDDILGHPVTGTSFEEQDSIDKSLSIEIFNALLEKKIVLKPKIKENVVVGELRGVCYNYGTSAVALLEFLKNCCETQGSFVQLEEFIRFLKQQVCLPGREAFWRYLLANGFLSNEEKYIVVDRSKMSFRDMKLLDEKLSQSSLKSNTITINEGEFLLYPDQLQNNDLFIKDSLKKILGPCQYAVFKEIGAISFQRKARFSLEKSELETVSFPQYDSVSLEDFTLLNISENDANQILDLLVEGLILKKKDKDVYGLRADHSKIQDIQLGPYSIYEESVKDLLYLRFCYRIAFQSIVSSVRDNKVLDITLLSKPHRRLVAELLVRGIIEPANVAAKTSNQAVFDALRGIKLDDSCLLNVFQRVESLTGSLKKLKMVPFPDQDRFANVEEWNLFSLNGIDLLLKVDNANFWKVVFKLLYGLFQIGLVMFEHFMNRRPQLRQQDLRKFTDGWKNICAAFRMACDMYTTDYYKLKYNYVLKRVALMGASYFDVDVGRFMRFAFEVSEPAKRDMHRVRKLATPLIRGFDIVSDSTKVITLIEDRLQIMCNKLNDGLLSLIDKNEAFLKLSEFLEKVIPLQLTDDTKKKLDVVIQTHLQRQQYFNEFEIIFVKIVEVIQQEITKNTQRLNVQRSVTTILSDNIQKVALKALQDSEPKFAQNVTKIVHELSGRLQLQLKLVSDTVEDQSAATDRELFIEESIKQLKKQLREKLVELIQRTIHKPVLERGCYQLMCYVERHMAHQLGSDDGSNPAVNFAKKLRIEQLKRESEERSKAHAMTPVESLLDQQFNEALAKWEQSASAEEHVAARIRLGEPIDVEYLEPCLDAVRFVLLRRSVVLSNVSVTVVIEKGRVKKFSSPRNFNGPAMMLHLEKNKFVVGNTQNKKINKNCLYDCLLRSIFELRSIAPNQFALEIGQHLVKVSENKAKTSSNLRSILDFNNELTFRELCFAQFLQACSKDPLKAGTIFGDLIERAKNDRNCARDWHGTEVAHVKVVRMFNSNQFVKPGFVKHATTDTKFGQTMFDLRKAFFKVYE